MQLMLQRGGVFGRLPVHGRGAVPCLRKLLRERLQTLLQLLLLGGAIALLEVIYVLELAIVVVELRDDLRLLV